MTELESQLKRIQAKVQQLLKMHLQLKKENEKLKQELQQLQAASAGQVTHIDQLVQQAEVLKMSRQDMNLDEKKALEKRLSLYVKEIDRCITLLKE